MIWYLISFKSVAAYRLLHSARNWLKSKALVVKFVLLLDWESSFNNTRYII